MTPEDRENNLRALVTTTKAAFRLENFAATVADEQGRLWVDPLDPRIVALLALPRERILVYEQARPLTFHSYKAFGTISFAWFILMCSGEVFAHSIPDRVEIALPTGPRVSSYLNKPLKNPVGSTIIF